MLCFPDHDVRGHRQSEFCGRSILVNIEGFSIEDYLLFGCFGLNNESSNKFHLNELISVNDLQFNPADDFPYYLGEEYSPSMYIINKRLKSWTMNMKLFKRNQEFRFYVFVVSKTSDPTLFKCISIIKSPPFLILSARSNNTEIISSNIPESLPDITQFSNGDTSTTSDIYEQEKEKNGKKIEDVFKFGDILTPVCDYNNLKLPNNEDRKVIVIPKLSRLESNISQVKDAMSFKSMEEALNDLYNSQPYTVYKVDERIDKAKYVVKVIDHINIINKDREELTSYGLNIIDTCSMLEKGIEILDKYGNKIKFRGICLNKVD